MREELMKKFAEDDRLEQVSEHKRRMKVTAVKTVKGVIRGTRMTKGFEMFFFWREKWRCIDFQPRWLYLQLQESKFQNQQPKSAAKNLSEFGVVFR